MGEQNVLYPFFTNRSKLDEINTFHSNHITDVTDPIRHTIIIPDMSNRVHLFSSRPSQRDIIVITCGMCETLKQLFPSNHVTYDLSNPFNGKSPPTSKFINVSIDID